MDTTVNVIRNRVDAAGVSGATVNSQGGNVVVQFPGVKNPETRHQAHRQSTAQLYFRPVLCRAHGLHAARQGQRCPRYRAPAVVRPVRHQLPPTGSLTVNTHLGQLANQHPARPGASSHPTTQPTNDDLHPHSPVLDPARRWRPQYPRFVLGPAELNGHGRGQRHRRQFDTRHQPVGGERHLDQ